VRVVIFCHSLVSDWNHGNAHFLRGIVSELLARGHEVRVLEPADGWSRTHLAAACGGEAIEAFGRAYPHLHSDTYGASTLDPDAALDGADLVLVHEWSDHDLVARIGRHRAGGASYVLLFHDTHHRSVTDPASMAAYDLRHYDGVLAFGDSVRDEYLRRGWTSRAWTWHEAADPRIFYPRTPDDPRMPKRDVVWIGNWGDEERTAELDEFLLQPVRALGLSATVYGVRYPDDARARLAAAGVDYRGWLPNHEAPRVFAAHKITVHVPRRPYLEALPGVPTIRPFEALACGIPLISARWNDAAGLFAPGRDFLVARDGAEMAAHMRVLLDDEAARAELAAHGLATIRARHTCAHRVDELMNVYGEVRLNPDHASERP
jgi:spore maturation protein CgeB